MIFPRALIRGFRESVEEVAGFRLYAGERLKSVRVQYRATATTSFAVDLALFTDNPQGSFDSQLRLPLAVGETTFGFGVSFRSLADQSDELVFPLGLDMRYPWFWVGVRLIGLSNTFHGFIALEVD